MRQPPSPWASGYEGVISEDPYLDEKVVTALRVGAGLAGGLLHVRGAAAKAAWTPTEKLANSIMPQLTGDRTGRAIMQAALAESEPSGFEWMFGVPYPSQNRFRDWLNRVNGHERGRTVIGPNGEPWVVSLGKGSPGQRDPRPPRETYDIYDHSSPIYIQPGGGR